MNIYKINNEGKMHVMAVLENQPYVQSIKYVRLISGEHITEDEVNELLNYLGQLPLKVVSAFFTKVNTFFEKVETNDDAVTTPVPTDKSVKQDAVE